VDRKLVKSEKLKVNFALCILNFKLKTSTIYSMKKIILGVICFIIVTGVAVAAYIRLTPAKVVIPKEVTKQNAEKKLTEYVPGWLPGTYEIDKDSFSRQEGQVFVFSATDKDRNRLFFSQQPIPKDFDFDNFYKTKVIDAVKLENVPYESVYARDLFGSARILSIQTEETWIMMTTTASIDQIMAQKIVQEIKPY
jgi:hypothetical protein